MKALRTFLVVPRLPMELKPLRRIALNLWWVWNNEGRSLFEYLDPALWNRTQHNPILMLELIDQRRLDEAALDQAFLERVNLADEMLTAYMRAESTWYDRSNLIGDQPLVAYFSAEFGITECLSIFAGGLGVLAGDHLKSSSDLGLPLVGVGLLYQEGYFHQLLSESGWQQELYSEHDFERLPLTLANDDNGKPLVVQIEMPGRPVFANVWHAQVGRISLYLLDTNSPLNQPDDRRITDKLYGGEIESRMKQEIVLGIGGFRALQQLKLSPPVCHMNEGHSAFLGLERVRQLMASHDVPFDAALEAASSGLIFTSHTPVPAGHDYFPPDLILHYFGEYLSHLGLSSWEFLALGRQNPHDDGEPFCMTILALKLANFTNAVSELHGEVTRNMWSGLWPGVPASEIPIGRVTNGIHRNSWIGPEMTRIYDRHFGVDWRHAPAGADVWQRIDQVSDEELWSAHEQARERLVDFARSHLRDQLERRGASNHRFFASDEVLRPDALTIGFGRRFASYKRATLLFRDPARLERLITNPERPVQIIIGGKAHPRDDQGKELIRQIVVLSRQEPFRRHIVFLEDYDIAVASQMVQGADVWLNNPRRPMEASGTSGMKAAANGVLNMSTLDGWWAEAWGNADPHSPPIGWTIGRDHTYLSIDLQDQGDADDLYDLLETSVVPTFYRRDVRGLPVDWIAQMRSSIGQLTGVFNTHRMVWQYYENFYRPSGERFERFAGNDLNVSREFACWKRGIAERWPELQIVRVDARVNETMYIGDSFEITALIRPGSLRRDEFDVQLYSGEVETDRALGAGNVVKMTFCDEDTDGNLRFFANL
ncbi:MAG TPA: alpha-glucan family phosphorylase, partial [Nitrolancea sp.]|nr:alpha-glucan family phosphorylase [Nitrolancea sp.]